MNEHEARQWLGLPMVTSSKQVREHYCEVYLDIAFRRARSRSPAISGAYLRLLGEVRHAAEILAPGMAREVEALYASRPLLLRPSSTSGRRRWMSVVCLAALLLSAAVIVASRREPGPFLSMLATGRPLSLCSGSDQTIVIKSIQAVYRLPTGFGFFNSDDVEKQGWVLPPKGKLAPSSKPFWFGNADFYTVKLEKAGQSGLIAGRWGDKSGDCVAVGQE
ncbi:MAG TPA: hypothetical protein VEQ63_16440 [Bryobacteraceae bacterium]|nr:hypothetical protein [Bryobacteraceae bacterium]